MDQSNTLYLVGNRPVAGSGVSWPTNVRRGQGSISNPQ